MQDTGGFGVEDSFMAGDAILVSPVVEPQAETQSVYLPDPLTQWIDPNTMLLYQGGQRISIPVHLNSLPIFYRGGTIIPTQSRLRRSSTLMARDPYTLTVNLDMNVYIYTLYLYIRVMPKACYS